MPSYSWQIPEASPPPSSSGPSSSSAGVRAVLGGLLDMEIDPVTLDYLDTEDGEWSETPDSRSIVLCQIELELGASIYSPGDGTRIKEMIRAGDPVTTAFVESELRRAMGLLEAAGVVGGVEVNGRDREGKQLTDETGRAVFELAWIDLATGSPVEDVYRIGG